MQNRLFRKSLVIGIIILFIGASVVQGISINNKKMSESKKIDSLNTEYLMINTTSVNMLNENRDLIHNPKDEYIDQQQTQHGSSGLDINYDQFVAQSFKPSVQRLSKVHLKLFKYGGTPNYELEFSVREILDGNDLVYVTKTGTQVTNGWNEFDFPDLQVQVDNTYYLVCVGDAGTGGDPYYCWYHSDTNPYNRGMVHIYSYSEWHNVPGADCCFKTIFTNDPPNLPSNPSPHDGATDVSVDAILSWECSDPDGDDLVYDVYFEANDPTPDELVSYHQSQTHYNPPGQMQYNTHYYWQIVAWDPYDASTSGPVWDFTTSSEEPNDPPDIPSDPSPTDGATGIDVETDLSWTCSDPDGDDLFYDVYFEADNPNPDVLVSDDQTVTTYDPGTLLYETNYYWRIIAKDEHGASTTGPVWQFRTTLELESDLECIGDLTWTKAKPGSLLSKEIYVENIGASDSLLDWEIIEWPDWGNWAFTPIEGYDLRPEDGQVTVHVFVNAPDEGNEHFSGHVTVVNKENAIDYEILDVSLTTLRNKQYINSPFLNFLQQQHPLIFSAICDKFINIF